MTEKDMIVRFLCNLGKVVPLGTIQKAVQDGWDKGLEECWGQAEQDLWEDLAGDILDLQ